MYQGVLHVFRSVCFILLRAHNGANHHAAR